MAKTLTDDEILAILDVDKKSIEEFKKYLLVLLESTSTHTIVIFDKIHAELPEDVQAQILNPHQVFTGSEDVNENSLFFLLWHLYLNHCNDNKDASVMLAALERIHETAFVYRDHTSLDDDSIITRGKRSDFAMSFMEEPIECSTVGDCIVSLEDFNEVFISLCNKYGFRALALYGGVEGSAINAGYSVTELDISEGSLLFSDVFAAMCENRKMGDCLTRAFMRLYAAINEAQGASKKGK